MAIKRVRLGYVTVPIIDQPSVASRTTTVVLVAVTRGLIASSPRSPIHRHASWRPRLWSLSNPRFVLSITYVVLIHRRRDDAFVTHIRSIDRSHHVDLQEEEAGPRSVLLAPPSPLRLPRFSHQAITAAPSLGPWDPPLSTDGAGAPAWPWRSAPWTES
jgi:hypothetical protein